MFPENNRATQLYEKYVGLGGSLAFEEIQHTYY